MPINCEIVSQDRIVFRGDVDIVVVPAAEGVMGILPNHAPVLASLKVGIITTRRNGQEEHFTISGGFLEVQPDQVIILADAAENVLEINIDRAEAARKRAEEKLNKFSGVTNDEYFAAQAALRKSMLRIDAAHRYTKKRGSGY